MYALGNIATLYIIELNTPAYIAFGSTGNIINDVTDNVIGIE